MAVTNSPPADRPPKTTACPEPVDGLPPPVLPWGILKRGGEVVKFSWKTVLKGIPRMLAAGAVLGFVLFFLVLHASLHGYPPYLQYALWVFGVVAVIAAALAISGFLPDRAMRWLGKGVLAVLALCVVYCGWGAYNDSIPTVDERGLMLSEYEPFVEGTKAVSLDEEPTLRLEDGPFLPRLDGATALYPVYAAFVQAVYPEGEYSMHSRSGVGRVACTGTIAAYERLIDREVDMIFCAGPSRDQLEKAEAAGMELHLTPIGREAFVFFVNRRNPVTGLTVEEVQKIYTGEITNWKEVGGKNQTIRAFQRRENSGSQTRLLKLMEGLPLAEPEKEDVTADMGGIIHQVASYRNYDNALGFSFRYYATEMDADGGIRLLSLDGVAPTADAIRDGTYPLSDSFYAVTAATIGQPAPEERDSELRALLDWILSPQGQRVVEKTGYVAEK